MFIPISISIPSESSSSLSLPPQIAKLGNDELVLIELQGSLDVECTQPRERDGQVVGKFRLDEGSGKPTLTIGHHLLEGKIVSLPKPLGVIQRGTPPPPHSSSTPGHGRDINEKVKESNESQKQSKHSSSKQWDMIAVVKKKIVFSKRPMPIVGSVDGGTKHWATS